MVSPARVWPRLCRSIGVYLLRRELSAEDSPARQQASSGKPWPHSVAGLTGRQPTCVTTRPFRAPHHTISDVGLIGSGQVPMPGEVSLAHHGILFLDELPECTRHVLDGLRQPLDDGIVTIARASLVASSLIHPTLPAHL
jgi:magnesium chelatase family protein